MRSARPANAASVAQPARRSTDEVASSLGEEISLLWERLDVGEAKQLSFRAAVKHSSISKATFKIGEKELAALDPEQMVKTLEGAPAR